MILFLFNLLLALVFMLLIGPHWVNFVVGYVVGFIILRLLPQLPGEQERRLLIPRPGKAYPFFRNLALFTWDFLKDLTLSNIVVAWDVWTPKDTYRPVLLDVPIDDLTDFEVVLLATRITLTPGTLSADVTADRKFLVVHAMYPSGPGQAADLRRPIDLLKKDLA